MSADLSIQNNEAEMFSARGMVPWHGQGTIVADMQTAKDALELAHLNWLVSGRPVSVDGKQLPFPEATSRKGARTTAADRAEASRENTWQAMTREDTGDVLGIMRGRYTPIQNHEAFSFFDRLIGQGKAVYDTAGALRGGRVVWLLAKIDGLIKVAGDETSQYALMTTSHDGSYSLMCAFVAVRVVCQNTLNLALGGAKNIVKIRHTENWKDTEAEAARVLGLGEHYFKSIQDTLGRLTEQLLTPEQMADFSALLFPVKDGEKVPTRTQNIRDEINRLFEKGAGNHGATRWDALSAVTDYADHYQTLRGVNSTRVESAILGSGAQLKQKAFEYLTSEEIMSALLNKPAKAIEQIAGGGNEFARLLGN